MKHDEICSNVNNHSNTVCESTIQYLLVLKNCVRLVKMLDLANSVRLYRLYGLQRSWARGVSLYDNTSTLLESSEDT